MSRGRRTRTSARPGRLPDRRPRVRHRPLMYNGVGGSSVLYAGDWPRLPSDFRVRTLDGVADDWPLTYEELEPYYDRVARQVGVSGLAGDPAYPPGEDPPLPPLPLGRRRHGRGARARPPRLALVARAERDPSRRYDGRHACAQWGTCMQGCPEGAKGSTDVGALAAGDRARGARWSRARARPSAARPDGLRHGRRVRRRARAGPSARRPTSWCSPRTRSARRGCSCCRPASVPGRPREHQRPRRPAPDDAPVRGRDRRLRTSRSRRGAATSARASTRCSSTRPTSAAASCAARSGASRRRPAGR